MPTYEIILILKKMAKPELKKILKRTGEYILEMNSVIRGIEYLGLKKTPFKIETLTEANYFVFRLESSETKLNDLRDSLKRDLDITRFTINFIEDKFRMKAVRETECDIDVDLLDVPFRPHVLKMLQVPNTGKKKIFYYGGKRNYDPIGN